MTDESTLPQGGSTPLPEAPNAAPTPPRSDAEAALQENATQTETPEQKAAREEGERKKNRTKEYIDRINRERAELAAENARLKAGNGNNQGTSKTEGGEKEPTLEDFDYDIAAFNKAHAKWAVQNELRAQQESTKQAEDTRKQQELLTAYNERAATFADEHPDFSETVGSIPYQLSNEVQAAIMAHPRGPEIAYYLGNNDDDAFNLSNVLPHVAAAAVDRLAKRITAAPQTPEQPQGGNQLAQPPKPVTRAPQPPATVGGRSPTETPPEKLTDDEWYRRDVEKRRKR